MPSVPRSRAIRPTLRTRSGKRRASATAARTSPTVWSARTRCRSPLATLASLGLAGSIPSFPGSNRIRARVMVRFIGPWIGVWINEVFIGATQDTTYTTGRCGIWNLARTSSSEATYFDNAAVYSLASTWSFPAYD